MHDVIARGRRRRRCAGLRPAAAGYRPLEDDRQGAPAIPDRHRTKPLGSPAAQIAVESLLTLEGHGDVLVGPRLGPALEQKDGGPFLRGVGQPPVTRRPGQHRLGGQPVTLGGPLVDRAPFGRLVHRAAAGRDRVEIVSPGHVFEQDGDPVAAADRGSFGRPGNPVRTGRGLAQSFPQLVDAGGGDQAEPFGFRGQGDRAEQESSQQQPQHRRSRRTAIDSGADHSPLAWITRRVAAAPSRPPVPSSQASSR